MSDQSWIAEARKYLGTKELPGAQQNNQVILSFWKDIEQGGIKDDETAWCAAFVGAMFELSGIRSTRCGLARSYLQWGVALAKPVAGCVAVFGRPGAAWSGHVGFILGRNAAGRLVVLGGNQDDQVMVATFPESMVLAGGYRWPVGTPVPNEPLPVLSVTQASHSQA